jgi:putative transposase
MPRPLRLQFANAIYHVINRGNYRRMIFGRGGAAQAFENCLFEAAQLHGWRLHAFAIMGNHFHLAVETPRPNLAESVHWLETTFAVRFNRFRKERGHLFQDRYQALLVEPGKSLARLVNYIHLNPVQARLVTPETLPTWRHSSLWWFTQQTPPDFLVARDWLGELQLADDAAGWRSYGELLAALAADPRRQREEGFETMTSGWAIGRKEWRQEIAASQRSRPILEAKYGPEREAIREELWRQALEAVLLRLGKTHDEARRSPKGAPWKVVAVDYLRRTTTATHRWLARALHMGKPASVRFHLSQARRGAIPFRPLSDQP